MTVMGGKRTSPKKGLQRKTGLKRTTTLKKQSKRAKEEMIIWRGVKNERKELMLEKLGQIICEYCLKPITYALEGHHNNHNRRENVLTNCRLVHSWCNVEIEDKNVKEVKSLL